MTKPELVDTNEPGLPRCYAKYAELVQSGVPLEKFGFLTTRAQVFRFANRFRVSRSFESIRLTDYAEATNRAYGALFRIVLTYSTIEQYMKITKLTLPEFELLLSRSKKEECLDAVRKADTERRFFDAVCSRTTDHRLAVIVTECMTGSRNELVPVMRAVRHGFAHGDLTPGANSAAPGVAQKLAKLACPLILESIESDFEKRTGGAA